MVSAMGESLLQGLDWMEGENWEGFWVAVVCAGEEIGSEYQML